MLQTWRWPLTATDLLSRIGVTLGSTATVKSVFGDPIHANGKTVVPVATVAYAFGGGAGSGKHGSYVDQQAEGGGGGGAVRAYPAGVLEITDSTTRFVPFMDTGRLAGGLAVAFSVGVLLGNLFVTRRRKA
jgi:uncharacterized spore protein YtfJ